MISDNDLYSLSVFLGSAAMLLTIAYHYLEVNAKDESEMTVGAGPVAGEAKKSAAAAQ